MTTSDTPGMTSSRNIERTIEVQGIATHLFEAGPTTAPALLYLHGTSLGNLWLEYHNLLAHDFHVFAPDIPGFGLTERPDWMRDMSDYVLYLRDLLNTLGLEQVHVVGHSLGGWMAAELAVWYPERVSKLVLSNAAGIRVKGSPIADLFAMNPQELVAACFDNLAAALPLMPAEMNVAYMIQAYKERATLASLAWNPHFDPRLARRIQSVTCPTLVIWGENDRLIPAVYGTTFHSLIPGSQLVMLSGTGHMPMFEQAEDWARHIGTFLQEGQA
ncbi:MAG TPA: alpha/beta hydrolase [Ktedonobacteraceae bacterium]|nr:alpha/beta hydrolase [Ktedonobacteraceae bacterium]